MTIGKYLAKIGQNVITCRPEDTAESAATLLTTNRIGAMPVRGADGRMVGIISERDLVRAFAQRGREIHTLRVADIMTCHVITCGPDDTIERAKQLMSQHGFRHLPVMENDQIIGMLSIRDTLATRLEQTELEVNVLRDNVIAARYR